MTQQVHVAQKQRSKQEDRKSTEDDGAAAHPDVVPDCHGLGELRPAEPVPEGGIDRVAGRVHLR